MSHRLEIAIGRTIELGTITPYRCWSNHLFLVIGPHILCKCKGGSRGAQVWQKTADHCPCGMKGYHHHVDGTNGHLDAKNKRVFCACGVATKDMARVPAKVLKAAATTYILNGYHGAVLLIQGLGSTAYPPHADGFYDDTLPDDFPPGR